MLTRPHEPDLAEIKALTYELGRTTQVVLERIRETQARLAHSNPGTAQRIGQTADDRPQARPAIDGNGTGPILAFVHIPKTAGGTVNSMLTAAYSKSAVQDAGNYARAPEKVTRKVSSILRRGGRVSAGHVPYGVFREHLPPDTRYMTFLREPVDRVLSHYYRHLHRQRPKVQRSPAREQHRLETPGKGRPDRKPKADSIEEAILEMRMHQLNNLATRLLCGHPSPMGELPPSALDDAKENLREFAFIGIQDRFEESLVLLQRMLGLGLLPYRDRHVSSNRPAVDEIPDEQRALIAEYNRLDVELYGFGLELFEDAVAAADQRFTADVETLRGLSAARTEAASQDARDWLDRELPTGTTKPLAVLRAAARPAGISLTALRRASQLLAVERKPDDDGNWIWTRPRGGLNQQAQ